MRSILVQDVVVGYGEVEAVVGASFGVGAGEVFGLLGPNGAGKTSLLRVLTTLLRPASGAAWVLGHDVTREPSTVRRLIGYVPQALSADGSLTGRENAALFAKLYDLPRPVRRGRIDEVLATMGLAGAAGDLVRTYSGGMIRRLEIACALLNSPRVLLLDEPTLGLDPVARRGVWEHLGSLRRTGGVTLLVTTHYMEEAEEQCHRVAIMSGGRVLAEGSPGELSERVGRPDGTLEDVFIVLTGRELVDARGGIREVGRVRRTARRLG